MFFQKRGEIVQQIRMGNFFCRHRKWYGCTQYIETRIKKNIFTTHYLRTFMRVLPFCHSKFRLFLAFLFLFHYFFLRISFLPFSFFKMTEIRRQGKKHIRKENSNCRNKREKKNPLRVQILFFSLVLFAIFSFFFLYSWHCRVKRISFAFMIKMRSNIQWKRAQNK